MDCVSDLKTKITELEQQIKVLTAKNVREKVDFMSSEVVDSNPYR